MATSLVLAAIAPLASSATPPSAPSYVPMGTRLTFVLDGTISSASSHANDVVDAHLEKPIALGGKTVVPAGTPIQIRVLDASPASNPDIYGFVDIFFGPLRLADGAVLPLSAPSGHLTVDPSAGHQSTVGVENTIGDIFVPTFLYHVFRKGRNFTLTPGAKIHALTGARLDLASDGTLAIVTPAPLINDNDGMPRSSFPAVQLATPGGNPGEAPVPGLHPSAMPTRTPYPGEPTPPPIDQTPPP